MGTDDKGILNGGRIGIQFLVHLIDCLLSLDVRVPDNSM